jgi:hypothetical protein
MNRRNGNGSLVAYAGASYDYANVPTIGTVLIKPEHWDKLVAPIEAIKDVANLTTTLTGNLITDLTLINSTLTTLEAQPRNAYATSGTGDCAAAI